MGLDSGQKERCVEILNEYINDIKLVKYDQQLDSLRQDMIEQISPLIRGYLDGGIPRIDFKRTIDSLNKKNPLWGFRGMKGMMFFNLLNSAAEKSNIDLDPILRAAIAAPQSNREAQSKMTSFYDEIVDISKRYENKRKAPQPSSVPYFLSYFWQIQDAGIWPIQYTSLERAFDTLGLWTPTGDVSRNYDEFLNLNIELRDVFAVDTGQDINLWKVEHVFYRYYNLQEEPETEQHDIVEKSAPQKRGDKATLEMLPRNYVPPIVSTLPRLARAEPKMEELCRKENKGLANVFEDLVGIAFKMLGYEVQKLGQGRGRRPDGIAFSRQDGYAIIYDAKSTKHVYELKLHSRQFIEYIQREKPMLMRQGMGLVFFAVVSGDFAEHQEREIKRIKRDSGVNEMVLLPADSLLLLIRKRLQDPYFSLGREGLLELLMDGGILSRELIEEFFGK